MTQENDTSSALRNGLPPPPIPQRLREMLKDYPGHLEQLQETLTGLVNGPRCVSGPAYHTFEVATWRLEGQLDAFVREAEYELEDARASGDAEAIAKAEAKVRLMRRAGNINNGLRNISELSAYFKQHEEALK